MTNIVFTALLVSTSIEPESDCGLPLVSISSSSCASAESLSMTLLKTAYEKKQGGLHYEDGTKIWVCSICHKPGHTKRNPPAIRAANHRGHTRPEGCGCLQTPPC